MECLHQRMTYASWRLQVFRRLLLSDRVNTLRTISTSRQTEAQRHGEREDAIQNEKPESKPTRKTYVQKKTPRPSELLPQSPLFTHPAPGPEKKRKKRPTLEDVDELRRNPWAVALASPPRMCVVSGTRIPKAFLGDWGMVQRPDSDGLWFMPVGLLKDELSAAREEEKKTQEPPSERKPTFNNTLRMLTLRIIDRLPILKDITGPLSRNVGAKKSRLMRLIPFRWKHPHGPITAREEKQFVWREDMPDFVLGRMRIDVLKKLKSVPGKRFWRTVDLDGYSEDALIGGLKNMEAIERVGCGGLLVMGRQDKSNGAVSSLPDFVTLPQTQSKVPVFDLSLLFSEADMEELKSYHPRFSSSALFFRPDNSVTVDAMLALWKLKGLLRPDENYIPLPSKA